MAKQIQYLPGLVLIKPQYDINPDTGEKPENILWFLQRSPVSLTLADLQSIGATFDGLWAAIWSPMGAPNRHYTGSFVQDYSNSFGLEWSTVGHYSPVVGSAGSAIPPNASMLISLSTNEHFRGGHFRIYLPYPGNVHSTTDPSTWSAGTVNTVSTKYGLLEPGMNGSSVGGGLTQRCYRHRYDATNARLDPIATYTVQSMIATQRRRLRKVPHH